MRWFVVTWLLAAVALTYGLNLARNALYDPSLSDPETRGVVIDSLCPAPVDPVTVTTFSSSIYRDFYGATFDLFGTAREDGILVSWDTLEIDGLTGYLITRVEVSPRSEIKAATLRVFAVDAAYGVKQYVDDDGLEPYTQYQYRVFPVTGAGVSGRSHSLLIRTLPTRGPAAPGRLESKFYADSLRITSYSGFLEAMTGQRVLRREVGESEWDIVHDGPTGPKWAPDDWPFRTWFDRDGIENTQYEYAVCLRNRLGIGRAALIQPERNTAVVPVGPPQGIDGFVTGDTITVYWEPLDALEVVGYEVERFMVHDDDTANLRLQTDHRTENYIDQSRYRLPDAPQQKYRIRAKTVNGPGEWSPVVAVDTSLVARAREVLVWDDEWATEGPVDTGPSVVAPVGEVPIPELVSLTASHSEVHLVWRADGSLEGIEDLVLRREVGGASPLKVFQLRNWLDMEDFDWDWAFEVSATGFTDQFDVRPSTEYEYAVQLRQGDQLGQQSQWMSITTRSMPLTPNRFPMQVYDLDASPTVEGILLTWTLPDDPTLTGIEIVSTTYDYDIIGQLIPNVALHPDATSYLVDTIPSHFPRDGHVCFSVRTFNNYGIQKQLSSETCVEGSDFLHCGVSAGYVFRDDYDKGVVVTFRGCEETTTEVTRYEISPDGLATIRISHQCSWEQSTLYRRPRLLECEFLDANVEPGTWYLYELTQIFKDGRTSTAYDEVATRRRR